MTTNEENIRVKTLDTIARRQEHSITSVNTLLGGKTEVLTTIVEEQYSTLVKVTSALNDKDTYSMVNVQSLAKILDDIATSVVDTQMDDNKVKILCNIYSEMEKYLTEILIYPNRAFEWENKTAILHCLIQESIRNSLFSHEELYKLICRMNEEWNDLLKKGISVYLIKKYSGVCSYYRKHGVNFDKYVIFTELLEGTAKLVPTYVGELEFYTVESEKTPIAKLEITN